MCQPQNKAGQRCASHTRKELVAATAAHTRACAATAAAHADLRAAADGARDPRDRTPENQAAVSGASAALTSANRTRDAANSVLHAARVTRTNTKRPERDSPRFPENDERRPCRRSLPSPRRRRRPQRVQGTVPRHRTQKVEGLPASRQEPRPDRNVPVGHRLGPPSRHREEPGSV